MIWLAYYSDWSGFAVFAADDEIGCLRYAVEHNMSVAHVALGTDVQQAVRTL